MHGGDETPHVEIGSYAESYDRLMKLIEAQRLESIVRIHKLDITPELEDFLEQYPHLQFKLVFLDAGTYDVTRTALEALWPRTTAGGIVVFDQFNHEFSPGETRAVRELLPGAKLQTFPWAWMPTAYVVR
jgi:predicted O-methyltransferase YrrM